MEVNIINYNIYIHFHFQWITGLVIPWPVQHRCLCETCLFINLHCHGHYISCFMCCVQQTHALHCGWLVMLPRATAYIASFDKPPHEQQILQSNIQFLDAPLTRSGGLCYCTIHDYMLYSDQCAVPAFCRCSCSSRKLLMKRTNMWTTCRCVSSQHSQQHISIGGVACTQSAAFCPQGAWLAHSQQQLMYLYKYISAWATSLPTATAQTLCKKFSISFIVLRQLSGMMWPTTATPPIPPNCFSALLYWPHT